MHNYASSLFSTNSIEYGIDGPCLGKMRVTENSADEAYSVMLDIIGCRLAEAFPELDIPYSIELVEEREDA